MASNVKDFAYPPWGASPPENSSLDIPWSKRDFCLNLTTGYVTTLPNYDMRAMVAFEQGEDGRTKRAVSKVIKPTKPQNPEAYPHLTFDEVKSVHAKSIEADVPLKVAYVLVKGSKGMSEEDERRIASCPSVFAAKDDLKSRRERAESDAYARFKADLEAAKTPKKEAKPQGWKPAPATV